MSDFFSQDNSISDSVTEEAVDSAMFGADDTQDVTKVADAPASSSETVVAANDDDLADVPDTDDASKGDADSADEQPKIDSSQEIPKEAVAEAEDLPNFKDAPEAWKNLREKYDLTKKEILELRQNSLQEKFFAESPDAFLDELNGLSTSQYQQTATQIVQRAINAMPQEFADYIASVAPESVAKTLASVSPDILAQALNLDMPLAQARKVIAQVKSQGLEDYLNDNETGDVTETTLPTANIAQPITPEAAKAMTPDDIEAIVNQRIAEAGKPQQVQALENETYAEIMRPVEELLSEAGLKALPTDSAEDKEFKEWASEQIVRDTFGFLMENEANAAQSKQMLAFIQNLDKSGVKHLVSTAKIKAEDYAGKRIEMLTRNRAKTATKGTEAKKSPPRVVPSGGVAAFGNPQAGSLGPIGSFTESDFESVGI